MKSSHNYLRLLLEAKNDQVEVERLLDLVFTPRRKLLSSYKLRGSANKVDNLSFVLKDSLNKVVGSIRFWKIGFDNHSGKGLLLGPLAIHPIYQSEGLGAKLVLTGIDKACANNWNWIVLVGDIKYYSRFGFNKKATNGVTIGNGFDNARLLGLDIKHSYLEASVGSLVEAN